MSASNISAQSSAQSSGQPAAQSPDSSSGESADQPAGQATDIQSLAEAQVEIANLRSTMAREQETARLTAEFYMEHLSRTTTQPDTLRSAMQMLSEYLVGMEVADPDGEGWVFMFDNPLGVVTGWSSDGADAEAAAVAHEQFDKKFETAIVAVPEAQTYAAVPLPDMSGRNPAMGVVAIPILPGAELTETYKSVTLTIATSTVMHLDRVSRITEASRSSQYALAAARAQLRLTEPIERGGALSIAMEALSNCDDLVGGVAFELTDGEPRVVAAFGEIDPDDAVSIFEESRSAESPAHDTVILPILLDGQEEAALLVKCRTTIQAIEDEMLGSITAAVAGSVARYRATGTIESLRRSATRRLVEAQERERSMVAADIHDGVLQQLGATAIRLELAQARVEQRDFDTASAIIEDGAKEIRSCARELRTLLMELRPQVLDDNGLNAALNELGRHVDGVEVEVTSDVPDDLGNEFSITIFRIVQEALTNIQKHANADTASVDVRMDGDSIGIEIKDDGIGYEGAVTGPSSEGSHLGLLGMRERARMLGGRFSITGESGSGTLIEATLPLSGSSAPFQTPGMGRYRIRCNLTVLRDRGGCGLLSHVSTISANHEMHGCFPGYGGDSLPSAGFRR
jgi:signal transduction histidine kinase